MDVSQVEAMKSWSWAPWVGVLRTGILRMVTAGPQILLPGMTGFK